MIENKNQCKPLRLIFTDSDKDLGLLILRLVFGIMMMTHGMAKIAGFAELSQNFPNPIMLGVKTSLILIIMAEIGVFVLVLFGLFTRLAAIVLAFAMIVAAFIVHAPFSLAGSELPLIYLGAYIALLFAGAGKYSVDNLIAARCSKVR